MAPNWRTPVLCGVGSINTQGSESEYGNDTGCVSIFSLWDQVDWCALKALNTHWLVIKTRHSCGTFYLRCWRIISHKLSTKALGLSLKQSKPLGIETVKFVCLHQISCFRSSQQHTMAPAREGGFFIILMCLTMFLSRSGPLRAAGSRCVWQVEKQEIDSGATWHSC